jgi:hypothetical protein
MPSLSVSVSGSGQSRTLQWLVQTTDATPITLDWLNLPSAGSGAFFNSNITAQQDNAQRAFGRTDVGQVNRNSTGTGTGDTISVGANGYVDTVTAPWNTFGAPAGWGAQPADLTAAPGAIRLGVVGAVGQTINWLFLVDIYLWGGAILLV